MSQATRGPAGEAERLRAEALLCAEVLADAQRQAEEVLSAARAQAADLLASAELKARQIHEEAMRSAEKEAAVRCGFILAAVPLEQARMRAAHAESLLTGLHGEAHRRLVAREGFEALQVVPRLAAEALEAMDGSDFELLLSGADHRNMGAGLGDEVRRRLGRDELRLEVEAAPDWSECGVIVRDRTGKRVWDNRVTARLERLWPSIRRDLAQRLGLVDAEDEAGDRR